MIGIIARLLRLAGADLRADYIRLILCNFMVSIIEVASVSAMGVFVSLLASEELIRSAIAKVLFRLSIPVALPVGNDLVLACGVAAISLLTLKSASTLLFQVALLRFEGRVNNHFGNAALSGYLTLPYERFANTNSSDMLRIINWRHFAGMTLSSSLSVSTELMTGAMLLASFTAINPAITLSLALSATAVGAGVYVSFKRPILANGKRLNGIDLSINRILMKCIQGMRDVRLFDAQGKAVSEYNAAQSQYTDANALHRVFERSPVWIMEYVGFTAIILLSMIILSNGMLRSDEMLPILSFMALCAWRMLPSIYRCISISGTIRAYTPFLNQFAESIEEFQAEGDGKDELDRQAIPRDWARLRLANVSFCYAKASSPTLEELSLSIPRGSTFGIVGVSGSGKSTLADIIAGLVTPCSGTILVDDTVLDRHTLPSWRSQIGFVSQAPYLFDGTLCENIAFSFGPHPADRARVLECCALAGITDFLATLPDGIDSPIGERGSQLSGGQAQRVAIARALYNNPELLIFDEATSSLDEASSNTINDTIRELSSLKTIVIIAHKLSALRHCTDVAWIRDGRLAMQGTAATVIEHYAAHYAR